MQKAVDKKFFNAIRRAHFIRILNNLDIAGKRSAGNLEFLFSTILDWP